MSIIKKKKHVSKKNKKAWRKHCDIRDVEEFLEDQRLEERLGKFDTKPDDELFVVDTGGEVKEDVKDEKPLSAKLRKRAKLSETPKCFEVLLPSSKVPDPNKKRNHVNPIGSRPTALSKVTEKRKYEKGILLKRMDIARKHRKLAIDKKRNAKKDKENFGLDLWGQDLPKAKGIPSSLCEEFISPEAQLHNVLPTQRLRPKPPVAPTLGRTQVETPHPGVSYNPTYQEHQELLKDVVEHEQKLMKREAHLHRVTTGMFSKITQKEKDSQWLEEMSVGLPQPHNPAEDPEEASDNEYKAVNPPVKNKKKDHKARRKQKERLQEKERLKRLKIDKKKITDIYKLRKLQSNISSRERQLAQQRELRTRRRERQQAEAPPVLSSHRPPRPEPAFVPPETLSGDLRHVSSTTNLLKERFESLQHRGALAASKVMMKKRRKLKSYFKTGHKVTDQEVQRYVNRAEGK